MFNIAICDSTAKELLNLMKMLDAFLLENRPGTEVGTDVFSKPGDLLAEFSGKKYDLLILDMDSPYMDGIETAREARCINPNVEVIYIANTAEKAMDAFSVNALSYLMKPFGQEELNNAMRRAMKKFPERKPEGIAIKSLSGSLMSVDVNDILYVESREKIIRIVQRDTDDILVRTSLSAAYEQLEKFRYIVKCGSSYIINLEGVKKIDDKSVLMDNGTAIPIPRRSVLDMKQKYAEYSRG